MRPDRPVLPVQEIVIAVQVLVRPEPDLFPGVLRDGADRKGLGAADNFGDTGYDAASGWERREDEKKTENQSGGVLHGRALFFDMKLDISMYDS